MSEKQEKTDRICRFVRQYASLYLKSQEYWSNGYKTLGQEYEELSEKLFLLIKKELEESNEPVA